MSTQKGRNGNKKAYRDTVKRGSAEQGMLVSQDAMIDEINKLRAAIKALGTKLDADAGVTDTNYNSTIAAGLSTNDLSKVDIK